MPEALATKLQDLNEVLFSGLEVLTEKSAAQGGKYLHFQALLQHADTPNRNGRYYPRGLLERELAKFARRIDERTALGAADHPDLAASVSRSAILWEKVWMEEDGRVFGQAKVLETQAGKDIRAILEAGGRIGISSRGKGTCTSTTLKGQPVERVNEDYLLNTFDVVIDQSVESALSAKTFLEQKERRKMSLKEAIAGMSAEQLIAALKNDAPEIHRSLMTTAVEEAASRLTGEFERLVEERTGTIREEVVAEMKKSGKVMDEATTDRLTVIEAALTSCVQILKEAKLIESEAPISDTEAAKIIETQRNVIAEMKGKCDDAEKKNKKMMEEIEQLRVQESIRTKVAKHPLAEDLAATLKESCTTEAQLNERFEGIKERFDRLASGTKERPKAKGTGTLNEQTEPAPIAKSGEEKDEDPADMVMKRFAGVI